MYSVDDFDYALPPELIAQHPAAERTQSRLLRLDGGRLSDHRFSDLPELLEKGDVVVFNDTRVIKARLFGVKESGGRVEVLVERIAGEHEVLAHVRASKSPKPGSRLRLADAFDATMLGREDDLFRLRFDTGHGALALLDRHGSVPLPPYIEHAPDAEDESRYQTVYARHPGSVAAPTAGLHFDESLLDRLRAKGIETAHLTLHVGAGTFQPMRASRIADHRMHTEWYEIPPATVATIELAHSRGRRVTAVGTTTLRALEGAAIGGALRAGSGETDLFVTPGFRFRVVDRLVTNFHLPKSTLLMLISAFSGFDETRAAYRHAVEARYRFFSYGDAMLADRLTP